MQKIDTTGASAPRWMSLIEAIKHIESGLSVSSVSAQVALKKKIGCGEFPVKWADALGPADTPNIEKLALSQLVLSTPGLAPDGVSLRPLLVLRSAVLAAWPQGGDAIDTVPETPQLEQAAPWMSLVEAVEHIRIVQGCDSIEALRQLKSEIGDGMVQIRWADQAADDEPDGKRLSASDLILAGTGIALDEREGSFRPLLIQASAVYTLWPNLTQKNLSLTASKSVIRAEVRLLYAKNAGHPPNVNQTWDLLKDEVPNISRKRLNDVLEEEEFKARRWPPGRHPQR